MAEKLTLPQFATEKEEAQWWFDHREEVAQAFETAAAEGKLRTGSAALLARERAVPETPAPTTISLAPDDICRARDLAAKRGLPY